MSSVVRGRWPVGVAVAVLLVAGLAVWLWPRPVSSADEASARAAAVRLLEADTAVGRLPEDLSARAEVARDAAADRHAALTGVWTPDAVEQQESDWQKGLELVVDDADYRAYQDNRMTVAAWEGTSREGDGIEVAFRGYAEYLHASGDWTRDEESRFRVHLEKVDGQWRLASVDEEQQGGN